MNTYHLISLLAIGTSLTFAACTDGTEPHGAGTGGATASGTTSSTTTTGTGGAPVTVSAGTGGVPDGLPTNCAKDTAHDADCSVYPDQQHAYLCGAEPPNAAGCMKSAIAPIDGVWCCTEGCVPKTEAEACDGVHCGPRPDGCGGEVQCPGYKCTAVDLVGYCTGTGPGCNACQPIAVPPSGVCMGATPDAWLCDGGLPDGCIAYAIDGTKRYACCPGGAK